ncbi:MAG: hypothetical protein U0Z44_15180 [Kouleothrix sp.]
MSSNPPYTVLSAIDEACAMRATLRARHGGPDEPGAVPQAVARSAGGTARRRSAAEIGATQAATM